MVDTPYVSMCPYCNTGGDIWIGRNGQIVAVHHLLLSRLLLSTILALRLILQSLSCCRKLITLCWRTFRATSEDFGLVMPDLRRSSLVTWVWWIDFSLDCYISAASTFRSSIRSKPLMASSLCLNFSLNMGFNHIALLLCLYQDVLQMAMTRLPQTSSLSAWHCRTRLITLCLA